VRVKGVVMQCFEIVGSEVFMRVVWTIAFVLVNVKLTAKTASIVFAFTKEFLSYSKGCSSGCSVCVFRVGAEGEWSKY